MIKAKISYFKDEIVAGVLDYHLLRRFDVQWPAG